METNLPSDADLLKTIEKPLEGTDIVNPTKSELPSSDELLVPRSSTPFNKTVDLSTDPSQFDFQLKNNVDNVELRAEKQSAGEQAINGITKGVGLAATTFATTFTSLPYGIGKFIADAINPNESARFADIYDNPISRMYDDFNKSLEKSLPNYYTKEEIDASLLSPDYWFTSNFLFDKLIKNAGFTVGAIASGSVIAKAFQGLGKLAMSGKIAEELKAINDLTATGKTWAEALAQVGSKMRLVDGISKMGAITVAAGSEASFEALDGVQTVRNQLIEKYKQENYGQNPEGEDLKKINDVADASGNVRFALNMGLLSIGDTIQFGKLFTGYKTERRAFENILKEEGKWVAKPDSLFEKILKSGKVSLVEANEEGTQFAIQKGTEDYYNRKYDGESTGFVNDVLHSTAKGLEAEFGTKEGWENILLGGISGLGFGLLTGEVREPFKAKSHDQLALASLAQYTASDIFRNKYETAVRDHSIVKSMEEAVKNDDVFTYKNLEWDKFKNFVASRVNANKFDVLLDELKDLKNLPKEEFEKTFGVGYDGNTKTVSDYVDGLVSSAHKLKELKDDIDSRFGMSYEQQGLDQFFSLAANAIDIDKRENQLASELTTLTKGHVSYDMILRGHDDAMSSDEKKLEVANHLAAIAENWIKTESPSPLDQAKAFDIVADLAKLRSHRHAFNRQYKALIDPEFKEKLKSKYQEHVDKLKNDQFEIYKERVEKELAAVDKSKAVDMLKDEIAQFDEKKKEDKPHLTYLKDKLTKIENELKTEAAQTSVDQTIQNVQAGTTTPKENTPKDVVPPPSPKKKIETLDDYENSKSYGQIVKLIKGGDHESALHYLEQSASTFKDNPAISSFVADRIAEVKRLLDTTESAPEPSIFDQPAVVPAMFDTVEEEVVDVNKKKDDKKKDTTAEPEPKKDRKKKDKEITLVDPTSVGSANIFLMSVDEAISETSKGDRKIVKNEEEIKTLLDSSFGVGSKIELVVDDKNGYKRPTGGHTAHTLPIQIKTGKTRLGFLNNLDTLADEITERQKIAKLNPKKLRDLLKNPSLSSKERAMISHRLSNIVGDDQQKSFDDFTAKLIENYKTTEAIRNAVFEHFTKTGEVNFNSVVTYKNAGSIIESSNLRDPREVLGKDVELYYPAPTSSKSVISDELVSADGTKKFVRNPNTSAYTNHDMQYTQGWVYVLVSGANSDVNDINTLIPSPLVPMQLKHGEIGIIDDLRELITNTLGHLKAGEKLNSQVISELRDNIAKYIHVNNLDDSTLSFKIHSDKIEMSYKDISDEERIINIYTHGYNSETQQTYPIEGFNIVVSDKNGTEIAFANSFSEPKKFHDLLTDGLAEKPRQVDYKKLSDPEYRNWIMDTKAITTDIGQLLDKKGNFVSNVVPSGKTKLVLSISGGVTTTGKKETKAKTKKVKAKDVQIGSEEEVVKPEIKIDDLEAKKAAIEKRRQEKLKGQGLVAEKIETYEGNNDEGIKTQIQIRTQRNGEKAMYVQNEEGRWVRGADKLVGEVSNEKHLEGILYDNVKKISEEKPESLADKKINAEYDAELAALESSIQPVKESSEQTDTDSSDVEVNKTIFAPTVAAGKYFLVEKTSDDNKDHLTYTINPLKNNPNKGILSINLSSKRGIKTLIQSYSTALQPAADIEGSSKGATSIEIIKTGIVELQGDKWVITTPMVVRFINDDNNNSSDAESVLFKLADNNSKSTKFDSKRYDSLQDSTGIFTLNTTKANDLIEELITKGNTIFIRETAKLVLIGIKKNNVNIQFADQNYRDEDWYGEYAPSSNIITFNIDEIFNHSDTYFQESVLHEAIHAITAHAIDNPKTQAEKEFSNKIKNAYAEAFQYFRNNLSEYSNDVAVPRDLLMSEISHNRLYYGFTNAHELVTELRTNVEFRKLFTTKKGQSIISKIIRAILDFFKIAYTKEVSDDSNQQFVNYITETIDQFIYNDFQGINHHLGNRMRIEEIPFNPSLDQEEFSFKTIVPNIVSETQPVYGREEDHHYVNILSGMMYAIYRSNPDVTIGNVDTDRTLTIKNKIHKALISDTMKKAVRDEQQFQIMTNIANGIINDDPNDKHKILWKKALNYVYHRLGVKIHDDFDIDEIKATKRDWNDTKLAEVSTKSNLSNRIKIMIMTTPKLKSSDSIIDEKTGKIVYTNIDKDTISGLAEFLDFNRVYPYILRNMLGASSPKEMLNRLEIMSKHDPSLIQIKHKLEDDQNNPDLLSGWYTHFKLQNPERVYVKLEQRRNEIRVNVDRSNKENDATYIISNKWIELIKSNIDNKIYDDSLKAEFNTLEREYKKAIANNDIDNAINHLVNSFNKLGINLDSIVVNGEITNPINIQKYKVEKNGELDLLTTEKKILDEIFANKLYKHIKGILDYESSIDFENVGDINSIAELSKFYNYDLVQSSYFSVDGKVIYSAMLPNFLSKFFNSLEGGTEEDKETFKLLCQNYAREGAMKYSLWLNTIMEGNISPTSEIDEDALSLFGYSYLDGTKRLDTKDSSTYTTYSNNDWELQKLIMYLKGSNNTDTFYMPVLTPADSGNIYFVKVPRVPLKNGEFTSTGLSRRSKLFQAVKNTILQEVERFKAARELLFDIAADGTIIEKELPANVNPQRYYHYKDITKDGKPILLKDGKPTGKVFDFHNAKYVEDGQLVGLSNNKDFVDNLWLYGLVTDSMMKDIDNFVSDFIHNEINNAIDNYATDSNISALGESYAHIGDSSFEDFIAEYTLNHYIHNVELGNFFYGNIAEYKSTTDTNKRANETNTPGTKLSQINTGETYKGVTLADVKLRSQTYDQLIIAVKDIIVKEQGFGSNAAFDIKHLTHGNGVNVSKLTSLEKAVYKIVESYLSINVGDAQGYVTLDRYRKVMKDLDKWSPKYEDLYKKLIANEDVNSSDLEVFLQPLKPFYYGRDYDAGLNKFVSTQVKYSLVPLIPQLTRGTQLDSLRKHAEEKGIDEIFFESAEKVGAQRIVDITDGKGNIVADRLNLLQPKVYYNVNWQQQLDATDHLVDETNKLGTQLAKLIIANINPTGDYKVGNDTLKGNDMINHYQDLMSANIEESARKLIARLGVKLNSDGKVVFGSKQHIQSVLVDELDRRNLSENYKVAIDLIPDSITGEEIFRLPLFVNNMTNKFESILTSLFTNNVIDQSFPGLHAVLLSDVFLNNIADSEYSNTGIEFDSKVLEDIKNGKRTTKLRTYIDENGGVVYEVLVRPWSKHFYNDDGSRKSINEIPEDVRTMIGYRIPTQAKHSMAYIKVVGFLPESAGSTMVFSDDIVTQMNSDFDFDTTYVMLPNFRIKGGKIEKIQYSANEETEAERYLSYTYISEINTLYREFKPKMETLLKGKNISRGIRQKRIDEAIKKSTLSKEELAQLNGMLSTLETEFKQQEAQILDDIEVTEQELERFTKNMWNPEVRAEQRLLDLMFSGGFNLEEQLANFNRKLDTLRDNYEKNRDLRITSYLEEKRMYKDEPKRLIEERDNRQEQYNKQLSDLWNEREEVEKSIRNSIITREEFSKLPITHQNTRKARQNRIFDLYSGILNSKNHVKEMITPAEFKDLTMIKDTINKAFNEEEGNIVPMTEIGQNVFRSKGMQGRALKGMAANANGFLSVAQVSNMRLNNQYGVLVRYPIDGEYTVKKLKELYGDDAVEITVNGKKYVDIKHKYYGKTTNGYYINPKGRVITEYSSQSLGNAVDIVKEGYVPNINTYTFSGWQTFAMLGIDWETASWFYNQPIIRDLTERYFDNLGLLNTRNNKEIEETKRKWQTELYKILSKTEGYKVKDEKLKKKADKAIANNKSIYVKEGEETNDLLKYDTNEIIPLLLSDLQKDVVATNTPEYYIKQLQYLEAFKLYKKTGEATDDAIRIFTTDRIGAGPSLAVTHNLNDNIKTVGEGKPGEEPRIMIGDKAAAKAVYPRFFDPNSTEKSAYPILEAYYKWGNELSLNALSPLFIQQSNLFRNNNNYIISQLNLHYDEKLVRNINNFILSKLTDRLPSFENINKAQLLGIGQEKINLNPTEDEFVNLSVANKLIVIQNKLADELKGGTPHILNYLEGQTSNDSIERNGGIHMIKFTDTAKDEILDSTLRDSLIDLWNSTDKIVSNFARSLIQYSFVTTGLQYGQNSFAKLIPSEILATSAPGGIGLGSYLRNIHAKADDESLFDINPSEVLEQFVQNNWNNRDIVPYVQTEWDYDKDGKIKTYFDEDTRQEEKLTKNDTPIWHINNKGILVVSNAKLKRTSPEIRKAKYIRVREGKYVNKEWKITVDQIFKRIDPDFASRNVFYIPINKLGGTNFIEFTENSILDTNNVELSQQEYIDIIETYNKVQESSGEKIDKLLGKIQMAFEHIKLINSGEKTYTARTPEYHRAFYKDDGIYAMPNGDKIVVRFIGVAKYNPLTKELSLRNPGVNAKSELLNKDNFARKEGYADWKDFEKRSALSQSFITGKGTRYIYSIRPVEETGKEVEDKSIGQQGIFDFNPTHVYTNHSGGATGADSYWDEVGQKYGVVSKHYWHGKKTPKGNVEITDDQLEEGWQRVLQANKTLKRRPDNYKSLLSRNWFQVKNADAIFAVSRLDTQTGIVDGGTGWAVQMAIDANKPVYVFNQNDNKWYSLTKGKATVINTPVLTKNFAGIGTREEKLTESGKQAIRNVYANTFSNQPNLNIPKKDIDDNTEHCL